ncbi:MAG TPA: hypothetical protein VHS56_01900, partial [Candidatus Cybelea sp.]|nr:hypothetical protein [Candidatus Cybelea sp.]
MIALKYRESRFVGPGKQNFYDVFYGADDTAANAASLGAKVPVAPTNLYRTPHVTVVAEDSLLKERLASLPIGEP